MSHQSFTTNPVKLRDLLSRVSSRKLALPDFQRSFVWEPPQVIDLLVSLSNEFPAGSILTLATDSDAMFEERAIEGAPELEEKERPAELILDGQQRITSLYGALVGGQSSRFFLDVQAILEGAPVEAAIHHLPMANQQGLETLEVQAKKRWFPLDRTFQDRNYLKWMREVSRTRTSQVEERQRLEDQMESVFDSVVEKIQAYEFPVVTLVAETSPEAVCLIFSKVNSTGVRLTLFDLLAARWWAHGVRLRTRWAVARAEYPRIRQFMRTDGMNVLRAIALKAEGRCTEKPILELKSQVFHDYWKEILVGLDGVLALLTEECGVLQPKYLPYSPSLLPLACVWSKVAAAQGAEQANLLYQVVGKFAEVELHPEQVTNTMMGAIFEELVRRFAEASNEAAGEHFTPREVIRLIVNLLLAEEWDTLTGRASSRRCLTRRVGRGDGGTGGREDGREAVGGRGAPARAELGREPGGVRAELNDESFAICMVD